MVSKTAAAAVNSGSESFLCQGRQLLLKHDGLAVIGWRVYNTRSIDQAVGEASRCQNSQKVTH